MALRYCCVKNCRSTSKDIRFVTFPNDVFRFQQWAEFTGNPKIINGKIQRPAICVRHFERRYFMAGSRKQRLLRSSSAIPTLCGPDSLTFPEDWDSDEVSELEPNLPCVFKAAAGIDNRKTSGSNYDNTVIQVSVVHDDIIDRNEAQDEDYDSSQSITEHLAAVAAKNAPMEITLTDGMSKEEYTVESVNSERMEDDDGEIEPLYLSSYLDGRVSEGRQLSTVVPLAGQIKSHSGYFTVNREHDSHMFFWFFPHASSSPVVVWINGPCESGSNGVFRQLGAYFYDGKDITMRPFAWTKLYSVLFIDAPVGNGYSFTNGQAGRPTDAESVGKDLYSTLAQFYELYFEYKECPLYIAGMGMGSKLALALAQRLVSYGDTRLKGVILGNPLLDVEIQTDHRSYLSALGMLDTVSGAHCEIKQNELISSLKEKDEQKFMKNFMEFYVSPDSVLLDVTGLDSTFSYVKDIGDDDKHWMDLINSPEMKFALHVGSEAVWDLGEKALQLMPKLFMESSLPVLGNLLENVKVMLINGQEDVRFPYPMMMNCARSIEWSRKDTFASTKRYRMQREAAGKVEGFSSRCETLSAVLIRRASHFVFSDRPDFTLQVFANFVKDKPPLLAAKYAANNKSWDVV